jgi:hypothetical protein
MPEWFDLLQWPAMVVTVAAALLVGSRHALSRKTGFWTFMLSNVLWIAWGLHDEAYALIVLQVCLCLTNIRGAVKNDREQQSGS